MTEADSRFFLRKCAGSRSLAKRLNWSGALFFCGLSRFEILPVGVQVYGDEGKTMGAKSFFGLRERWSLYLVLGLRAGPEKASEQ